MSTTNLFTATGAVYSEFDALRTSSREYNIPDGLVNALDALGPVLAVAEIDKQKPAQINPMVDINASGTIHNAQQVLWALRLATLNPEDIFSEDERTGIHYMFVCIIEAMRTAELQAEQERKAA